MCGLDSWSKTGFWKIDKTAVRAVRRVQYSLFKSCISLEKKKNMKTASSISGNHSFLGPVNFYHDSSHYLIATFGFHHSPTLLSSTPKIAVSLWFPFFSVHRTTARLNFRFLASLFHNYGTWQIWISTSHILTTKLWTGFRWDCTHRLRKARFTLLVWLIGPRCSHKF
jgi:hypothetical protein